MNITEKQARMLRGLDIVLVDDNRALLGIVSKILNSLGVASLRTAPDGTAALGMMQKWPGNLVITDLDMQPMNGLTMTRKIRAGHGGLDPRTPIIALTGNADAETVKAALLAGVNGMMIKPVEPMAMINRIEKVIFTKVVYQLKGDVYVANPKASGNARKDLVYEGLLPRVRPDETKMVDNPVDSGQEDDAWVLD